MTKEEKDVRTNVCCFVLNSLMMFMDVYDILMMFMDVYGKQLELMIMNVWMIYCWYVDFVFQRVSFIFKRNSVQTFNFLLCMCLGGAFKV